MKGRQIVIGRFAGLDAAALMVDGRLEDVALDPSRAQSFAPGAILRGRVDRLVKGQGGVFLRLPEGARGFLRGKGGWREGQDLLVQVSGAAEPGKALPLTTRLLIRGRYVIVTPGAAGINVSRAIRDPDLRDELVADANAALAEAGLAGAVPGLIIRSAAAEASPDEIADELIALGQIAVGIAGDAQGEPGLLLDAPTPAETAFNDWTTPAPDAVDEGPTAFDDSGAGEALRALLSARVSLPGGGFAMIESTSALVAVDVNTGPDTSPAAALKANIALLRDLPRQLRLRGLGGQVVIDFAPVSKRDRGTIEQELQKAFRGEAAETALIGWTRLGLFELTRKRDRAPLHTILAQS
ncbi:MAG: ribonuclease E/G [Paracoccus sp. (in: a-proteobacteria)]|nr:ribonuclease E/G [Paracoccus sp. (in: a-proteobacteria)]